jgi:ElaB/YqjD/DUF883 family membrane-anchored ribosome-binding protein
MTSLTQTLSATEKDINKFVNKIKQEAPVVAKETVDVIDKIYLWVVANPIKAAGIVGFIVGFILGTLV